MVKLTKMRSARIAAILGLCAVACAGPGTVAAGAVEVAGQQSMRAERTVGTDTVKIRLTQGNPDDDGKTPSGNIQGVTIHLTRIANLDPTNADDAARMYKASLDEVRDWPTDIHLEQVTNANGEVMFDGLSHGFYVVTSSAPDDSYREINSFVVAVPFHTVTNNPNPVPGVIVAKTHKPGETPTPPPTPPTTPTNPGKPPSEPETTPPSSPDGGESSPSSTPSGEDGSLAMTGAQVIGVVAAAAFLIIAGFALIAFGRRKSTESEGL